MMRQVMMAAALAGGIFLVPAMQSTADAAVVGAKASVDAPSGVTLVRRGGGGGGWGGGGGGGGRAHIGGGGMGRSFAGPRMGGSHRIGRGSFSGHRSVYRGHAHRHHHHHGRDFLFIGAPFYGYYYDGYYGYDGDCYWLKRRALRTGSSYWWNRYYACQGY